KIMTLKDKEKVFYSIKSDANLSEENRAKIISEIDTLIRNTLMEEIFNDENFVFNEKELFFENNTIRMDKLSLAKDGKIYLLDFKTGDEKPSDLKQIKNYQIALEKLNFENIQTVLYYTKFNKIVTA
ncbi:MAG: hypothetical protein ACLGGV_05485, partial [Bacteroidia bacterium]